MKESMNKNTEILDTVFSMLHGDVVSVSASEDKTGSMQWNITGENYPHESANVRDDGDSVIISVDDMGQNQSCTIYKGRTLNSVRLWYLESLLKRYSKSGEFYDLVKNVKLVNNALTALDKPGANVSVFHEVAPILKVYNVAYPNDNSMNITFNGVRVRIASKNDAAEHFMYAYGYMKWKLGVLQRDLDKKIEKQEKAKAKAEKISRKQQEKLYRFGMRTRLRCALADLVLGRGHA